MLSSTTAGTCATRQATLSPRTADKAARLFAANAATVVEDATVIRVKGDTGSYTVTLTETTQSCDCDWTHRRGRRTDEDGEQILCSHIGTALLVIEKRDRIAAAAVQN